MISIIIPVYNASRTLKACLTSIFNSDYDDYEIIVVDDCSIDNSVKIAEEFNVRLIKNKVNSGPAYTRNQGAKISKGDVLCFIDPDVLIKTETLEKISKKFVNKKISAVQTIYSKFTPISNFLSQYQNLYGHYIFKIINQNYLDSISSYCIAIKKKDFFKVGGFDESIKDVSIEDENLGILLSSKGYNILLAKDIETEHLAYFTISKLLKRMFRIASAKIKYLIKKPKTRKMKLNKTHHSINLLFSVIMSPLILFSTLFAILFLLVNFGFLKFIYKNKGFFFTLKSIIIYYLVCLSIFIGFISGGISYITNKIYRKRNEKILS